jgi:hypothetical protein
VHVDLLGTIRDDKTTSKLSAITSLGILGCSVWQHGQDHHAGVSVLLILSIAQRTLNVRQKRFGKWWIDIVENI